MIRSIPQKFKTLPTPMAGLALGVASLGWCMENALPLHGFGQLTGALIATGLLLLLCVRYLCHFSTLLEDLRHPVLGSIVPTFAMCLMVLSKALGNYFFMASVVLWCLAVTIHLCALALFIYNRLRSPILPSMVPSWFVPPVGIIVADVSFPGLEALRPLAEVLLCAGMASYAVMLPLMLYRLMFGTEIPNQAKPTIAIMAAPASLSLAGYLTMMREPNLLLCAVLLGIALFMTVAVYFAFWRLFRLQFSPGYAAFTFPMAIGATALYKCAAALEAIPGAQSYIDTLRILAHGELVIATVVIAYVLFLYAKNFRAFLS